jgi:hypothetical protein
MAWPNSGLSEGKGVGADAGVEEFDLETMLRRRSCLPDQLVEPVLPHAPKTFRIHIGTVAGTGRRAINPDAEANRTALNGRTQYEVKIAGVKTVADRARRPVERGELASDGPIACQAPSIERG